ncbi:EamA family transporter [Bacillus aerolatus]|uniref:EamA family transporter n=1 Tax=Bacillus aerolatus TaxID=2653354 RepID=A0A6I1FGF9_9BACI|nr:DMT family transporter [Bacillus aerolatus]KAB7707265.1 EamA family transporter [Bacillus aerolatus]
MCLFAVLTWGGMYPVMADALKIMDPFYITLFRYGSVSIVFVFWLIMTEGKEHLKVEGRLKEVLFLGTMGFAGFSFLVFLGQQLAGPSGTVIAAVIMATQPLLGVIVIWITQKTTPKPLTFLFMLTAFVGVVMVISKGDITIFFSKDGNLFANFLILIGAVCWVIYTSGGSSFPDWSPLRYTTVTSIYGYLSIIVIVTGATLMGWLDVPTIKMFSDISGALIYISLIAGVLAVFSWNAGNKILTPINGIVFMNLLPVTTFVISVIQGYELSLFELAGMMIVILSLIANNLYIRKVQKEIALG